MPTRVTHTDSRLRDLALSLHDLSLRIARFGPAQLGIAPLPATELAVLRAVLERPGSRVSEVASAMSMQGSNVSAAVRSLTDRGLVERRSSATDGRVTLLYPTKRAMAERDAIENAIAAIILEALPRISDAAAGKLLDATAAMRELAAQIVPRLPDEASHS